MIHYASQGVSTAKHSGVYEGENIFGSNAAGNTQFPAQHAFPISLTFFRIKLKKMHGTRTFPNIHEDYRNYLLLMLNKRRGILRKQLCMDMTVITQIYCQLYIKCQLHVSANTIFGHHQVGFFF